MRHVHPAALLLASLYASAAPPQDPAPAAALWTTVTFSFEPPNAAAKAFSMKLGRDGRGSLLFAGTAGAPPADARALQVGPTVLQAVAAAEQPVSSGRCETHLKHIAQTGKRTLAFGNGTAFVSCSFNYSDASALNDASAALVGVEQTVEFGDELARLRRFDRLGLDAEMQALQSAVADGRARDVGNIAPVLDAIAADDRVIDRVRRAASALLERKDASALPSA